MAKTSRLTSAPVLAGALIVLTAGVMVGVFAVALLLPMIKLLEGLAR